MIKFMARAELLNLPELRSRRPDWTDRLPHLYQPPTPATKDSVRWHWSYCVPAGVRETYTLWKVSRRHQRNLEQIEIDELGEISTRAMHDDSSEALRQIYEKHAIRRVASRFLVATTERRRLERLAKRWDVECPKMIERGEANEPTIAQVRRAIREARWTFFDRCSKVLIPILSLLVALAALLRK